HGARQRLGRALGLERGESAPQLEVRARGSVSVAEQFEYRDASAEVVRGEARVLAPRREQALKSLLLAREREVARGVFDQLRNLPQEFRAEFCLAPEQVRFGEQEARLAHGLPVAYLLGERERAL